ncbi:MAG: glycosyltransferase [Blautia sp.]|nr:glycosyltransferase [Blautia sp.]
MSPKALMLSTVAPTIGQFNKGNIEILQSLGYEVHIAADFTDTSVWPIEKENRFREEMEKKNVKCFQIGFSRSLFQIRRHLSSMRDLEKLVEKNQYALIHTHTAVASAIGRVTAHRHGVRIIYTAHGFAFYQGGPRKSWLTYYPVEKLLSRWTDLIITINREDYEMARKRLRAGRVEYVPGVGIDLDRFRAVQADREAVRASLGLQKDDIMLFSVGELCHRKNHAEVIKALSMLAAEGKNLENVHYFICGPGELLDQLDQMGKQEKLNVHLMGYRYDVAELYKSCDLFVFPSFQEGLPVALMEAMACEAPVICSRIRGNVDLIRDEESLFDPKDALSLKARLEAFLTEDARSRNRKTEENLRQLEGFALPVINGKMKEIYSQVGENGR